MMDIKDNVMDTKMLLEIVNTRIKTETGNPTSSSFLYSIVRAINELEELRIENRNLKMEINKINSDNT